MLDRSNFIINYPITPGDSYHTRSGWSDIYRTYLQAYMDKIVLITEPTGKKTAKTEFLGFDENSLGMPYPQYSTSSQYVNSCELTRSLNQLVADNNANVYFFYGHNIKSLTRFCNIANRLHHEGGAGGPTIIVALGLNTYANYNPEELKREFDIYIDLFRADTTTCLESEPRITKDVTLLWLNHSISQKIFEELTSLSTLVGCTGAASLSQAIKLGKMFFYEARYSNFQRPLIDDLIALLKTKGHDAIADLINNFRGHGVFADAFQPLSQDTNMLLDRAFQEQAKLAFQGIIESTDLMRKLPPKFWGECSRLTLLATASAAPKTSGLFAEPTPGIPTTETAASASKPR